MRRLRLSCLHRSLLSMRRLPCWAAVIGVLLIPGGAGAAEPDGAEPDGAATASEPAERSDPDAGRPSVFEMPRYTAILYQAGRAFLAGDTERAIEIFRSLIERYPNHAPLHVDLAITLLRDGQPDAALEILARAVDLGYPPPAGLLRALGSADIADSELFQRLSRNASKSKPPDPTAEAEPALVKGRVARVSESNTRWDPERGLLISEFRFPEAPADRLVMKKRKGKAKRAMRFLNALYTNGKAAGNHKDLYDNRDDNHSRLGSGGFPQFSRIRYSEAARKAGLHYGPNTSILFDAITFGNSSTALVKRGARSMARHMLTMKGGPKRLFQQYTANHIYVYPEHRDHDGGRGDLFPANTSYMVISQGSSGSDRAFLRAIATILAALPPAVKDRLRKVDLIAPTVQMILRRGMKRVRSDSDYLSPIAHPTVFRGKDIELVRMIRLAQTLTPETIPPMVKLTLLHDLGSIGGFDTPRPVRSERLFTTPSAIGRIARANRQERRMTVSVGGTRDPNGRALSFHWRVLRGDADRVRIEPRDEAGRVVDLVIPWQSRAPVPGRPDLMSSRVDIGVFADNGAQISAPALVSLHFPQERLNRFDESGRLLATDYTHPDVRDRYFDPRLYARRHWEDVYHYDSEGELLGWTRTWRKPKKPPEVIHYTRHGARVLSRDSKGRPLRAGKVRYETAGTGYRKHVTVHETGEVIEYRYSGPDDRRGEPTTVTN